ncbi:helix-turn-helix protein [Hypnocyclicus thermotrophus]|uniref:Helix-turn-helix protein n=1 Tax=Hypnocyclicus thermotrophus TaxID=1627895 RepID=A0AA46DWW1_9FUSO|nr:helix-turn-helix transcriptional regulator [Hypnocyclicus thermotrophus]TDT67339.1 helix-turn-helix protein [Hypnocyclicus thermotrophus]
MKKIITPNEKLKLIRKKYGLKQSEITGNIIKRNTISMIETGKNNLTEKTAKIIVDKINDILKKRGLKDKISLDYLLESVESQVKNIIKEYNLLLEKSDYSENVIIEIDNFLIDKYDSIEKINLYNKIANYYFNQQKFFKAILYYSKSLDFIINNSDDKILYQYIFNFLLSLYNLRHYEEFLTIFSLIEPKIQTLDYTNMFLLLNIRRSVYIQKKMYKKCINDIEKYNFLTQYNNIFSLISKNFLAESHYYLKNYSLASEFYSELIESKYPNLNILGRIGLCFINYELNYLNNKDECINYIKENINNLNNNYLTKQEVYCEVIKLFSKLNNYSEVDFFYKNLIKNNFIFNNNVLEITELFLKDSISQNDFENILFIEKIVLDFIHKEYISKSSTLIYQLIKYYEKNNYIDNLLKLIKNL